MSERPILFSGPMVQAILDRSKTQTRRVIKLREFQPSETKGYDWTFRGTRRGGARGSGSHLWQDFKHSDLLALCPYGKAGDRLYVRETWASPCDEEHSGCVYYRSTDEDLLRATLAAVGGNGTPWRPSIHMPRWASRLTLEITGVRVERLQDITAEDAISEGAPNPWGVDDPRGYPGWRSHMPRMFRKLWDDINAKRGFGWDANPWVWVVEFRRVVP